MAKINLARPAGRIKSGFNALFLWCDANPHNMDRTLEQGGDDIPTSCDIQRALD